MTTRRAGDHAFNDARRVRVADTPRTLPRHGAATLARLTLTREGSMWWLTEREMERDILRSVQTRPTEAWRWEGATMHGPWEIRQTYNFALADSVLRARQEAA